MQKLQLFFKTAFLICSSGFLLFATEKSLSTKKHQVAASIPMAMTKPISQDSTTFQSIVDSLEAWISAGEYYRWRQKAITHQMDSLRQYMVLSTTELQVIQPRTIQPNSSFKKVSVGKGKRKQESSNFDTIRPDPAYRPIDSLPLIPSSPTTSMYNSLSEWNQVLETWIADTEQNRVRWEQKLDEFFIKHPQMDALRFQFRGGWYRICIASRTSHTVQLHANKSGQLQPLATTWKQLNQINHLAICLANGGMYQPDGTPVGLLIENGKLIHPINRDTLPIADNFHMYPNGIFYTDTAGKFYVASSNDFKNQTSSLYKEINEATQSGPMLVINGRIHPKFSYGSPNTNIRNGVGILRNSNSNTAVFAISETKINLYDFALLFQKLLRCDQALYLDGAISKMYYSHQGHTMGDLGGSLGPVISISKKTN